MKSILRIISVLLAATLAHSQEELSALSCESATAPTARILGDIPDGTPLLPEPPKPKFIIPANDILETTTHQQGGRTITVRKINPIALPPPPPPAPVRAFTPEEEAAYRAQLDEYREAHPKSGLMFLGATVFRSNDSPPRTLVRYWPEGGCEDITFWSSADFALIAGGIHSFMDSAGETHSLIMSWDNVNIDRMADLQSAKGIDHGAPDMPDLPDAKAAFQVIGKPPAAEEIAPIQALHDLYNNELARLKTAYEGREHARIEREAYLKAHPPQPKDIVINYWRNEKPAAQGGTK